MNTENAVRVDTLHQAESFGCLIASGYNLADISASVLENNRVL